MTKKQSLDQEYAVGSPPAQLRDFRDHLLRHFAPEEESGFLDTEAATNPGAQRTGAELLVQHRDLAQDRARLVDGVQRASQDTAGLSDAFVQGPRGFLTHLMQHEGADNELVQKLVLEESGRRRLSSRQLRSSAP